MTFTKCSGLVAATYVNLIKLGSTRRHKVAIWAVWICIEWQSRLLRGLDYDQIDKYSKENGENTISM